MKPQTKNRIREFLVPAIWLVVFLYGLFYISPVQAASGIYERVNFQGKLVNNDGTNVTNGSYNFTFTLFDASSGGTNLWTETQSLTVTDGIFRAELGTSTAFGATLFDNDNLYLAIQINSGTALSPRIRFTAVPYAFNSKKVNGLNVTNTNGTLTVPSNETINFGSNSITFTTSADSSVTLPSTGTLATLAGSETLTNKTIGSTGLVFSGATTDIDAAASEGITIQGRAASSFNTTSGNLSFQIAGTGTTAVVQIGGGGAGSTTPDYFALDVKSTTGDPATAGAEGYMYYNTFDNKFRCYEGSGFKNCIADLDDAYDNDADKVMAVDSTTGLIFNQTTTGDIIFQDNGAAFLTLGNTGSFSMTLDATDNPGFSITNNGSGNIVANLAGTGDWILQDNGAAFLTISDAGAFNFTLDATDNPTYNITNLGTGDSFQVYDASGDTSPFVVDQNGNVGIGDATPDSQLEILGTTAPQMRLTYTDGSQDATFGVDANGTLTISSNGTTGGIGLQADGTGTTAIVQIGAGGAGSNTPDLLAVDVKNTAGDPATTQNGYMYFNTNTNRFRCYQGGWVDCIQGTAVNLQNAYDGEADRTMDVNQTAGLIFNMTTTGDFIVQDNGSAFFTLGDTGSFDLTLDATDNPTMLVTNNGTGNITYNLAGTGGFVVQDNGTTFLTLADNSGIIYESAGQSFIFQETTAGAATNDIVQITTDATNTSFTGDLLHLTMNSGTADGFTGDGLKVTIDQSQVSAAARPINVEDDTGLELFTVGRFGFAYSNRGFVSFDGYMAEEFNDERASVTADSAVQGDWQNWVFDEQTNCTYIVAEGSPSFARVATGASNGCALIMGIAAGDVMQFTSVTNLPKALIKFRPSATSANDDTWVGLSIDIAAGTTEPTEGLYFTNNNGTTWTGRVNPAAGGNTDVVCTGQTISTTQFALLEITVENSTTVRFRVDNDLSNGISFTDCGTANPSGVTSNLGAFFLGQSTTTGRTWDIDYFRVWTDDPNTAGAGGASTTVTEAAATPLDMLSSADIAEAYLVDEPAAYSEGDVVAMQESGSVKVRKSNGRYDRNLMGVITTSPYLVMGTQRENTVNVALNGRVPVKVNLENGPIQPGDYLTSSSVRGEAMKALKAGPVIGRALETYTGPKVTDLPEDANKIMMFVAPTTFMGELAGGTNSDGVMLLSRLIAENTGLSEGLTANEESEYQSQIFADRLVATNELVTSQLMAETIYGKKFKNLPGADLDIELDDGSNLTIRDPKTKEAVMSMDNAGNATFAGTLTAKKIKAEQIEGLAIYTDKIESLSQAVNQLTNQQSTQDGSDRPEVVTSDQPTMVSLNMATLDGLEVSKDATISGTLNVGGNTLIEGVLNVISAITARNLVVEDWASFIGQVIFKNNVYFTGRPTFNKDTAGYATIKKGQRDVTITFEQEYLTTPIVVASFAFDKIEDESKQDLLIAYLLNSDLQYAITNKSTKGFTVSLNKEAGEDVVFSWVAIAVTDVVTAPAPSSNANQPSPVPTQPIIPIVTQTINMTPLGTPTPTPLAIPVDPVELKDVQVPTDTPTPQPEASPNPTNQPAADGP